MGEPSAHADVRPWEDLEHAQIIEVAVHLCSRDELHLREAAP